VTLDLEHFAHRVIQDALAEATSRYWQRRARAFDQAHHGRHDFLGRTTPEQRSAHDAEMTAIATACRHRADLAPFQVVDEVAA
jgi:hypothetical protein